MRRRIGYMVALAFAPAVLAVGCAKSDKLDIGDGHEKVAATGASLSDYAGSWDGYAEAYTFIDGSDRIRLKLDAHGEGTLEVGDSPALPAPDPDKGYPPSDDTDLAGKPFMVSRPGAYPGFGYPVSGAKVESKRIRIGTSTQEVFREWCEMQEPVLQVGAFPTSYGCANGVSASGDPMVCMTTAPDGTSIPIDCGKAGNCLTVCQCTETKCGVTETIDTNLDAALGGDSGDELTGTLVLGGERIVVRMTRM
jgi:hypothetical protein